MNVNTATIDNNINMVNRIVVPDIIKEYQDRLKGFIRKRVHSLEDVEDVLQDVYYQLTLADMLMKPIDQISSWLFTVARNRITDLYRKKKPELLAEYDTEDEENVLGEINEIFIGNDNSPESDYLNEVILSEVHKALQELPVEQREAFELTEIHGLSFKEISEQTGETVNTLISRKRYAVLHLRERLKTFYNEIINV